MDVVLRTPHGEGEISLVVDSTSVTLSDVVERVVGHAAPPVVYVDGRAASANTFLSEAGVVVGSLIDTDDATHQTPHSAPVELWQRAGPGGGTNAPLLAGDYRIGPGRRIHANELAMAPVDEAVMELRVKDDGRVMVRDRDGVELIGGASTSTDRFVTWTDEPLSIHGRIFQLVRSTGAADSALDDRAGEPVDRRATSAGTITFHRPVTGNAPDERRSVPPGPIDALGMARARSAQLWQRRGLGPGEFRLPLGLHVTATGARQPGDPRRDVPAASSNGGDADRHLHTIETILERGRGLAYVGRADFTRSAASSLVILAATMYGPADLDIVVATTPDRANSWEWVKWLPHSRVDGQPDVIVDDQHLRSWLRRRRRRWATATSTTRRTLMVVDDENAWHERSSPLREIVGDESAPISFAVLTTHLHDVPTLCETVVSERSHGIAHIELRQRRRRFDDVHAYIVTTELATEIARRLAPLDDAAIEVEAAATAVDPVSILDLHDLGADPRPSIAHRWNVAGTDTDTSDDNLALRLGHGPTGVVTIDLAALAPHTLVVDPNDGIDHLRNTSDELHHAAIDAAVIGACADLPPDELEVVLLSGGTPSPLLSRLPHVSVNMARLDAPGVRRAMRSLDAEQRRRRSILEHSGVDSISELHQRGDRRTLRHLLVVLDQLDAMTSEGIDDLRPLIEVGADVGMHAIVRVADASHLDDSLMALFGSTVLAQNIDGGPSSVPATPACRSALRIGAGRPVEFDPPTLTRSAKADDGAHDALHIDGLLVRPFVVARDLTPMEKRLVRSEFGPAGEAPAEMRSAPTQAVAAILDAIAAEAATRARLDAAPIADDLPTEVDLIDFLAAHPGDGIPFALADVPETQGHEPAWWLPGADSSIAAFGVARSKVSALVPTLVVGASHRLGIDDVRFHIVCAETATLAPLAELPHTASLTSARARTSIEALLDQLQVIVNDRLRQVRPDLSAARVAATETPIVLLIDDVGGCRRLFEGGERDLWAEFEHLLVRGQPVGVCAVLVARRSDEISARLAATIGTHLVSQLATNDDAHQFGIVETGSRPAVAGRIRRITDGIEMQIATLPADLVTVVAEHAPALQERAHS